MPLTHDRAELMPLHDIPQSVLRDACRRRLETLELWLKRVVHEELSIEFGDYLNAQLNGLPVIKSDIRKAIKREQEITPTRRPVDAMSLEQLISVICNHRLFKPYFAEPFQLCFSLKEKQLEVFLNRLGRARNRLSHTQHISILHTERVLCYTDDIILSLKRHYKQKGKEREMNRPFFTRFYDNLGNEEHLQSDRRGFGYRKQTLYPGETLGLHVEVDASFKPEDYDIKWRHKRGLPPIATGSHCLLVLDDSHVNIDCEFSATLIANKVKTHLHGHYDDMIIVSYKVLAHE